MSNDLEHSITVANPLVLVKSLIDKGLDPKEMIGLAERMQANADAAMYSNAVVRFQSLMPAIEKKAPVYGKDKSLGPQYYFATFEDIMEVAQPILTECGIGVSFDTKTEGNLMTTTCFLQVGSHIKSRSITLGLPQIPNADDCKRAGGAMSYGKRYALVAALNIRVKGEDTDAQNLYASLTKEHTGRLNKLIDDVRKIDPDFDSSVFWDWVYREEGSKKTMADLPDSEFARVEDGLLKKLKKGAAK